MLLELQSPTFLRVHLPLIISGTSSLPPTLSRSIYPQIWMRGILEILANTWLKWVGFWPPWNFLMAKDGSWKRDDIPPSSRWANPPCSRSWHASPAHRGEAMRIEPGKPKDGGDLGGDTSVGLVGGGGTCHLRRFLGEVNFQKWWVGSEEKGKFWLKYGRFFWGIHVKFQGCKLTEDD